MIIQNQQFRPRQSYLTDRQLAFEQGLGNLAQGLAGVDENLRQQQETERERALLAQNQAIQLRQQGYDVSPEEILRTQGAEPKGGFASLFEGTKSAPSFLDLSKRTPEYLAKQEALKQQAIQEAQDKEFDRKYKMSQLGDTKAQRDFQNQLALENLNLRRQELASKAGGNLSPQQKLKDIGAEGRSKIGSIVSGLQAIDQMSSAIELGYGPKRITPDTSIIGTFVSDDPYTERERILTEVVGRLQTGAVISDDEKKTFLAMGPRPGDSPATQNRKIGQQKEFLRNKLTAFGLQESELPQLGFDYQPSTPSNMQQVQPMSMSGSAFANEPLSQAKIDRLNYLRQKAGAK
jgi:hypothetical protein